MIMNDFHGWSGVNTMDINRVVDMILTGHDTSNVTPDMWLLQFIGDISLPLCVLDFGSGVGRNTFGLGINIPRWSITGYDNVNMLSKAKEFYELKYKKEIPPNVEFQSDWKSLSLRRFDVIFCDIVLQHIYKEELEQYIFDFKKMTHKLVVCGRRFNDDGYQNTWTIIEDCGLVPTLFQKGHMVIPYSREGNPDDHNIAVYTF